MPISCHSPRDTPALSPRETQWLSFSYSSHSGKLANVYGGSTADGAAIIQWPSNGGDNQQWSFSPAL